MTILQEIHNFIFGENRREDNRHEHMMQLSTQKRIMLQSAGLIGPDLRRVWGIDISRWDGNVDLSVTKSFGASFVWIKGLDGTVPTRYFPENRARAIAANLPQGPYQWLYRDANVRGKAQAQAADTLLQKYPADMPLMIDFEWTKYLGLQANPNYNDLRIWATEFLRLGHRKPILYSAAGYMNPLGRMPNDLRDMFYDFNFANYGVNTPTLPMGFEDWDFWQFAATGDAMKYAPNDANKKELDLNYYNGTPAQFANRYGGVVVPPPSGPTLAHTVRVYSDGSIQVE